ncbi:hypothetical protein K435DRAFT_834762 [Dendrothele bispora CBS 962.96]|uniref:Uncharacterized protein n=1 Tax=Dendrothele bispora (strain CBS 962.96) TaxID=1314807 RepID=A0A4S8MQP1_DENBC|nr:hypothetical protein K435DRAFT_834762 [Dendrothele bispora CBS 962.96]
MSIYDLPSSSSLSSESLISQTSDSPPCAYPSSSPLSESSGVPLAYDSSTQPLSPLECLPSPFTPELLLRSAQDKLKNIRIPLSLSARRGYTFSIEITPSYAPIQTQKGHLEPKAGSLPRRKKRASAAPKPVRIQDDPKGFDFSVPSTLSSHSDDED